MPGIYIMAIITIAVCAFFGAGVLFALAGAKARYLWLLLPALPLSAVVNLWVKRPVAEAAGSWAGIKPGQGVANTPLWFIIVIFMMAPVFEEAIKVVPLLIPRIRAIMTDILSAQCVGLALGISFGIGEIAYLAWGVAQSPQYAGLPWYMFTGFLNERFLVAFVHGIMTSFVVLGLYKGRMWIAIGYLGGVASHGLVNLGALLYQLNVIPVWAASLMLYIEVVPLVLIFALIRVRHTHKLRLSKDLSDTLFLKQPPWLPRRTGNTRARFPHPSPPLCNSWKASTQTAPRRSPRV